MASIREVSAELVRRGATHVLHLPCGIEGDWRVYQVAAYPVECRWVEDMWRVDEYLRLVQASKILAVGLTPPGHPWHLAQGLVLHRLRRLRTTRASVRWTGQTPTLTVLTEEATLAQHAGWAVRELDALTSSEGVIATPDAARSLRFDRLLFDS